MGVDKSKWKKKFIKNHNQLRKSVIYKKDDIHFVKQLIEKKDQRVFINDGSIDFEEELKMSNVFFKRTDGHFIFNRLTNHIKPYLKPYLKGSGIPVIDCIPVIVQILDKHYRPPMKDIDLTRCYRKDSKLFSEVSDANFPLASHPLKKQVSKLESVSRKLKKKIKKAENDILYLKLKLKKDKAGLKRLGIKKKTFNTSTRKTDKKNILKIQIKQIELKNLVLERSKIEGSITNIFKKNPADVWVLGKGNPDNRKMVYKYLTDKWRAFLQKELAVGQLFILDGAVVNHTDEFKHEYCALQFRRKIGGAFEETVLECNRAVGSQIGEGEQSIMYYINTLITKKRANRFIVRSTDTDLITYIGKNWRHFEKIRVDKSPINIILRCKNFYYRTDKWRKKFTKKKTEENSNKIYIISFCRLTKTIEEMYPELEDPLGAFFTFWGIFLGCDFIAGVHKTIQKHHSIGSKKGDKETQVFLEFFFLKLLNFKVKSEKVNKDPLYQTTFIKNDNFENDTYYNTHINKESVLNLLNFYRHRHGMPNFNEEQRKKILITCKNTEYVSNYMLNQYRIKDAEMRRYPFPPCHLTNDDNESIFGYVKSAGGKIIQEL